MWGITVETVRFSFVVSLYNAGIFGTAALILREISNRSDFPISTPKSRMSPNSFVDGNRGDYFIKLLSRILLKRMFVALAGNQSSQYGSYIFKISMGHKRVE